MDTKQLTAALDRLFNEEGKRIVFWHDPDREFLEFVDNPSSLLFDNTTVNIVRLDQASALETKIRLEREDPTGRYLLYSPTEEPDYENDWLLDIRLYSRSFRADRASIILDELGLANQHLRQHLADRRKFFDSKERLQKLKPLVAADDTATDLDRKIIAVVVKADQPELFTIIRTLFHAYTENGDDIDLDTPLPVWEQLEKFDLAETFWHMTKATFGYADEDPSLKKFLLRLLVTDYVSHLKADLPAAFYHLVLPPSGRSNAIVCLAQWRDSNSKGSSYDRLSAQVATLIKLEDHLHGLEINDLIDVMTFQVVEQTIASNLRDRVQSTADTIDADAVRAIASRRQAGHWASPTVVGAPEVPRMALHALYGALVTAADFFALRNRYQLGFDFPDASAMYRAYEAELYRFDQLYRHFCEAADQAESQGWSILKSLREFLEACYTNWYVPQLALAWGKFLDSNGSTALLNTWQLETIPNQYRFYERHVRSRLEEAENRRTYVIISDAFRYEAAQELTQELNGKYRFEATLGSQLGVLPSYTALGMASLLPHKTLTYKANGDVLMDGKPTASLEQRNEILQSVGGIACIADDLMAKKKDAVHRCLGYALEARRRVKEQLKKIGGMEFFDVHFSYIDQETLEEKFISVPEQGGGLLIPDGPLSPGVLHTVATGSAGHLGLYRLETQVTAGSGSLRTSGLGSNSAAREAIKVGFDYFKANASRISASIKAGDHDYHLHVVELHNTGPTTALTLSAFVALCSGVLGKPVQQQMVILGSMSLGGSIIPVENLAESLQVAFNSGAKRILLPMASVTDIPTIPGELFAKFQTSFYADPTDAVFKALGVN